MMALFASGRGRSCGLAVLALAVLGIRAARGAEARPMLVATHDPALLSALDAAFSPRGVRVAMADRPLRASADDLGAGARGADLVWLCDMTPAPAAAPSRDASAAGGGPAAGATALCVRPHQGRVIIRRIAVATPLSPEDAAALALSVQVALMPDAAAPAAIAQAASPGPLRTTGAAGDGAHSLTLELASGVRGGPYGSSVRASVAAAYLPPWLGHHLGIGFAVTGGPAYARSAASVRGPGPPSVPSSLLTGASDIAFRPFARGQARVGPLWLQLDLGPEAHVIDRDFTTESDSGLERWYWSLDGFVGAVVPFGRFFAGARVGASEQITGRHGPGPIGDPWNSEALVTVGVGGF